MAADPPEIDPHSARLDILVARGARKAVVFRRGPSRHVRLLVWHLVSDTIEPGQWLRGRLYARRADLSPDGEVLAYFAASFRPPFYSWTAISRPPYFRALALWPKGDGWGGGGLFRSAAHLELNHRTTPKETEPDRIEDRLAEGFALPKRVRVTPLGDHPGWGEDQPIEGLRRVRDGWTYDQTPVESREHGLKSRVWVTLDPPETRRIALATPHRGEDLWLRVRLHGIKELQGRWLIETAEVVDGSERVVVDLGRIDAAEPDHNGDVLFARNGALFRLPRNAGRAPPTPFGPPKAVADLNDMRFARVAVPKHAQRW